MLSREAREFNERQQRSVEYYDTAGRGLGRIEDELKTLNRTVDRHLAVLVGTVDALVAAVEKLVQIAAQSRRSSTDQRQSNPNER